MKKTTPLNIRIRARAASDIGQRANNEDAFLVDEAAGVFIVADGMGGHDKGEVASWFTSESLDKIVRRTAPAGGDATLEPISSDGMWDGVDPARLMEFAVLIINKKLFDLNEKEIEKAFPGGGAGPDDEFQKRFKARHRMGTTLVSLLVRDGKIYIAHVGDSRAYRLADGRIELLTHDHTWVEDRIRSGELPPEAALTHEKRNVITRSVGFKEEVRADINVLSMKPPERFLLCSDGLSNVLGEADILDFGSMDDLQTACDRMVEAAKDRGGRDNITTLIVEVTESTEVPRDWTDI
ncbi:MAG: protein phosphatase 2C domain-containing protein [bacterium]